MCVLLPTPPPHRVSLSQQLCPPPRGKQVSSGLAFYNRLNSEQRLQRVGPPVTHYSFQPRLLETPQSQGLGIQHLRVSPKSPRTMTLAGVIRTRQPVVRQLMSLITCKSVRVKY